MRNFLPQNPIPWQDDGPRHPASPLSMDADSTKRINRVVDAVLERCAGSLLPHSLLRDCLKEIEADGSLSAEEIAAVEAAVLRALSSQ